MDLIKELKEIKRLWNKEDIDKRIDRLITDLQLSRQKMQCHSFAAFRLRDYIEQHDFHGEMEYDLHHIANLMDNELEFSISICNFNVIRAYIESYLAHGGTLPEKFLDGLWQLDMSNPVPIDNKDKKLSYALEKLIKVFIPENNIIKDKK